MNILLHPTFPSISHFAAMVQSESITFEVVSETNQPQPSLYL
jgi:hypothetical protein